MYFVDRKKITKILEVVEEYIVFIDELPLEKNNYEFLALERMMNVVVEGILDVGNAMIDGFIMRDPGSYEDIIDILVDESVVSDKNGEQLKNVISLRKMLVQDYFNVNHVELKSVYKENKSAIDEFTSNIHYYLEKELGPVSAFIPEEE